MCDSSDTMRVIVGAFALLVCPARCLLRVAVTPAPVMTSHPAPAARAVDAILGGATFMSGGHRRSSRRRALIAKVHCVARGGGGQEGKGILAHAASLPLVQALPPQVCTCLVEVCVSGIFFLFAFESRIQPQVDVHHLSSGRL